MEKVFYKNRTLYLANGIDGAAETQKGLIYRYKNRKELNELLEAFSGLQRIKDLTVYHKDRDELNKVFKSCFTRIKAGGGLVYNSKGEFLAIKRNGNWDLPKGKQDRGERFKETALREVEEETGLKGLVLKKKITATYHIYRLRGKKVLKETRWYRMVYKGQEDPIPQNEEGITQCRWVKPGKTDFITKNTYSSIIEVLEKAKVI